MPSIRQAAERLGVSPSLLYRLCQEEVIPHRSCRVGRRLRIEIDQPDVERFCRLCRLDAARLTPAHFFRFPASD